MRLSIIMAVVATVLVSCTPQARRDAANIAFDIAKCVIGNQGETDEAVYARCAKEEVSKEDVLRMLTEAREATAAQAKAACSSPDAGAPDASTGK